MTLLAELKRCPTCMSADVRQSGDSWECFHCQKHFPEPVILQTKAAHAPRLLPFRVWCECRHISGQHGAEYPHPCACNGNRWVNGHGSICDCQAFKSPGLEALKQFLTLRDEIAELEHDCDPEEFTNCPNCTVQQMLEVRYRRLRELWAEEWAMILRDQLGNRSAKPN